MNYNTILPPFKWFVLQNFPYIEDDFDALTNWQLFSKLGKEMNKIIEKTNLTGEQVENLTNAYNELKAYVDNYFENLDVQDEINNKLDEMAESGQLAEIIGQYLNTNAILSFNSVSDMKLAQYIKDGSFVETFGYYSNGDGGSSKYKIRQVTNEDVVDDKTIIALYDENLVAELIISNEINVEQFGVYGDGTHDDTTAIQYCINKMKNGMSLNFGKNKKYLVSDIIETYQNININGNGCYFIVDDDYDKDYILKLGTLYNASSEIETHTRSYTTKDINIIYSGTNDTVNGIFIGGQLILQNIYTSGLNKSIQLTTEYFDKITIDGVEIWNKRGTDYAINTGYLGDGIVIKNVHMYQPVGDYKVLEIGSGHNCVDISTIINGKIKIGNSNVNMKDIHLESGNIETNKSKLTLQNAYILKEISEDALHFVESYVNLENVNIIYISSRNYDTNFVDLYYDYLSTINTKNCFKSILDINDISKFYYSGLNSNMSSFNDNKLVNSLNSNSLNSRIWSPIQPQRRSESTYETIGNIYKNATWKWKKPTATYYYDILQIYDKTRMVGNHGNTNVKSSLTTENDSGNDIQINGRFNTDVRIYRGTENGSYDSYCDLGLRQRDIIDNGIMMNGEEVKSRTPGGIDTFLNCYGFTRSGENVICYATTIPTAGTWIAGDIIYNASSSGTAIGWICTLDGTPGTWKSLGTRN